MSDVPLYSDPVAWEGTGWGRGHRPRLPSSPRSVRPRGPYSRTIPRVMVVPCGGQFLMSEVPLYSNLVVVPGPPSLPAAW